MPRHGGEAEGADVSRRARSSHVGHDKHAGHSVEMFRNWFWAELVLTVPAVFWDPPALAGDPWPCQVDGSSELESRHVFSWTYRRRSARSGRSPYL